MLHLATALLEAELPLVFDYVRSIDRRYLTTLVQWWNTLAAHVRTNVSASGASVTQWLEQQHPVSSRIPIKQHDLFGTAKC